MLTYTILESTFDELVVNEKGNAKEPYKFFILVNVYEESSNTYVKYQIKFNEDKQRHNANEFIAHYIGSCSEMPLINGTFLELDNNELKKIQNKINTFSKGNLKAVDLTLMQQNIFFGIEWKQHVTSIDKERELLPRVLETVNKTSFFSLYAFDQFFKNLDRHLGNHLVVKEGNSKKYRLIDFDRIFASTNWSRVSIDYKCFKPFVCTPLVYRYHAVLMNLVVDSTLKYVHFYAGKLQGITDKDIKDMSDIILQIYDVSEEETKDIRRWIEHRREHIVMSCLINEKYFPRIKKGLYSVS